MRNKKGQFVRGNKGLVTHNMARTRPYNTWNHMMFRCYSPKDFRWNYYGGRGIKVCMDWHTFEGFWKDMKEGYFENAIIDRIDNNKNYKKKNCRWVTIQQSGDNKRNSLKITHNGEERTLSEWCRLLKINYHKTYLRLYRYNYSIENALNAN